MSVGSRALSRAAMAAMLASVVLASPARAADPTVEELMRRLDALQRRVDELEARRPLAPPAARPARPASSAAVPAARPPPAVAAAPAAPPPPVAAAAPPPAEPLLTNAAIPGLLPPLPVGTQFEDALRSDLPGIALRVPGTDTQVRLYGFAKLSAYTDLDGRNPTDAPPPSTIPLANSPAALQGGDFGMTARFSRIGVDTRTLTDWGTLETRIEGDFGGGSAAPSSTATFRLRQAWAEVGTDDFGVLVGQTNSLWNEGVFETLIDATNLNQSFTRQAQVRVRGRLAKGLVGQVSLEAPETQYTSAAGVFTPTTSLDGGASPAFNSVPDLLGRLTYRNDGLEIVMRGLLRQLSVRTAGTAATPSGPSRDTPGWGTAVNIRVPMRWISPAFGADELLGMAYYGQGIGRYFGGNSSGQDALSNIGLPGTQTSFSLNALPTYGGIVAYRRFWLPQLRSNFSYAYARQDYPDYALQFTPGSASATSLNRDMQQVFVNLIWSPFATVRDGLPVGNGWLDVGLEYLYTRRDVFGGSQATGAAGSGLGVANRFVAAAIGRF